MNTLIIGNQPVAQRRAEIVHAWKTGKPEAAARLDFESLEGAWKLLIGKRWAILRAMAGQGPLAIREIARRVASYRRALGAGEVNRMSSYLVTRAGRPALPS
jgi:predicted transcriptional regulator